MHLYLMLNIIRSFLLFYFHYNSDKILNGSTAKETAYLKPFLTSIAFERQFCTITLVLLHFFINLGVKTFLVNANIIRLQTFFFIPYLSY